MRSLNIIVGAAVLVAPLAGCAAGAPTAKVGECLDIALEASTVTELAGFDCGQEHDAEVYFVGESSRTEFDQLKVAEDAADVCRDEFASFIGIAYEESVLDIYYVYPQADSWENGDREVICAVYEPDPETGRITTLTGTLAGAQR
jgi:hypothetical protein